MRRFALLIGNGIYDQVEKFPPLKKSAADVRALAEALRSPQIGAFDEVLMRVDLPGHDIRLVIEQFFQEKKRTDLLLLYLTGHGEIDRREKWYFVCKETQPTLLSSTAVSASFIRDVMDGSHSDQQIVILDTCYAGAFFTGAKGEANLTKSAQTQLSGSGRSILAATSSTQLAWEGDEQTSTSLFTRYLVQGLITGAADINNSGWITVDGWFDYTANQVRNETLSQTPRKQVENQQGSIVVAKNPFWVASLQSSPLAPPPIPVANIIATKRSDEKEDDGLLLWDNRQGQYVIQLATHPAKKLERDPSFKKLLPGTYHFAYLNEKSVLIRAVPIDNASLLASYCSIAPLGTTHEEQALQLHQKALCEVFQFDLNDLMVNRQRSLSDKQVQRLSKKRKLMSVGAIVGIFVLIGLFLFLSIYWRLHDLDLIVPWLFIIIFILFLGVYARNQAKSIDDLQSTHIEVKREEGRIVRTSHYEPPKNNGSSGGYIYKYRIGKLTFWSSDSVSGSVSDQHLNNVLFSEINYGIFYIESKVDLYPQVVSIEPLEVLKQ